MSLIQQIDTINILNKDIEESTVSNEELIFSNKFDHKSYVLSDADEELIILIQFKAFVDLNSITLHAFPNSNDEHDSSPPKKVHFYKINNLNKSFDEIKSIKPDKSIQCSLSKLQNGQRINLKKSKTVLVFNKIKYMAIYIETNQQNSEVTNINGIEFNVPKRPNVKLSQEQKEDQVSASNTRSVRQLNSISRLYRRADTVTEHKESEYKCICGGYLRDINQKTLAVSGDPDGYNCDICRVQNIQKSVFWHCPPNDRHRAGFDVCNNCIAKYNPKECNVTPIQLSTMNSSYLLYPNKIQTGPMGCNISSVIPPNRSICNNSASKCKCLHRLKLMLNKYDVVIAHNSDNSEQKTEKQSANSNDIFTNKYTEISLLNDFNHLLTKHDDEFCTILNVLLSNYNTHKRCNLSNCCIIKRNYRNRSRCGSTNLENLHQMYGCKNVNDISKIQFMDRIHCYYFHSLDTGHRLSDLDRLALCETKQNDSECDQMVVNIRKLINLKRQTVLNVDGLERITSSSKFSTNMDGDTNVLYSYGVRYFYWDYYKNNSSLIDPVQEGIKECYGVLKTLEKIAANECFMLKEFYVMPIFTSVKDELLKNIIYVISLTQWNMLVYKAKIHLDTTYCKEKMCIQAEKVYGIKQGTQITYSHLIAIMVYCNFDKLQNKFSMTYRRISKNESHLSMIKRHSNFAHLGRLLRECVECYPSPYTRKYCWKSLYHGITIAQPIFMSMNACIKGPVSTTTDYAVAVNFCQNEGPILEFNLDDLWVKINEAMLCECWCFSDYPNEQEVFFIGGFSHFLFQTIIFPNGANYKQYVFPLNAISDHFNLGKSNSAQYFSISSYQEQICFRIFSHQLHTHYPLNDKYYAWESLPTYASDLIQRHFESIDFCAFPMGGFIGRLFESIFCYDSKWINLDLFTTVFPGVKTLTFLADVNDVIYQSIYSSLMCLIAGQRDINLRKIKVSIDLKTKDDTKYVHKIVDSYKLKYKQLNWEIYIEKQQLTEFVIIKSMFTRFSNGLTQYIPRKHDEIKIVRSNKHLFM
eukprot:331710_1